MLKARILLGLAAVLAFSSPSTPADKKPEQDMIKSPVIKAPYSREQLLQEMVEQYKKDAEFYKREADFYRKMYEDSNKHTEEIIKIYDNIIRRQQETIYELSNPETIHPKNLKQRV